MGTKKPHSGWSTERPRKEEVNGEDILRWRAVRNMLSLYDSGLAVTVHNNSLVKETGWE